MTQSVEELGLPSPKERRRLREAADLTHEQVAAAVGVAPATVRSWETGRTDPRGRKREVYARFLRGLAPPPDREHPAEPGAAEDGPGRGSSLRATGSARGSSGGGQGRSAHSGSRPRSAAKRAAKPPADRPRHETAKAPPGTGPATGSGSSPSKASEPAETRTRPAEPAPKTRTHPAEPAPRTPVHPAEAAPEARTHAAGRPTEPRPERAPEPVADRTSEPASEPVPEAPAEVASQVPAEVAAEAPAGARTEPPTESSTKAPAESLTESPAESPAGDTPATSPEAAPVPGAVAAFDTLYGRAAPGITRQAYLLTGRRALAHRAVDRAFQQAWAQWPQVATDPDPVGWVRAVAYEYALSPWHQLRRGHRRTDAQDKPPAEPADRILLNAMLALPPAHRRTVLLYDGVGLDLPDTAAETEASTPTTALRLLHAHEELAELIPELVDVAPEKQSALLHERIASLRPAVRFEPRPAAEVRVAGENRARRWTRAVLGLTAAIAVATAYTVSTAPTEYEPPQAPGTSVSGVPPHSGPQRLTEESRQLHDRLRSDPAAAHPGRLVPMGA